MATALGTVVNGLDRGSVYALVALGLTLLFRTTGLIDFARGPLVMAGAAVAVGLEARAGALVALAAAMAVCAAAGLLQYAVTAALPREGRLMASLVATLGFGVVVTAVLGVLLGSATHAVPPLISGGSFTLGNDVIFIDAVAAVPIVIVVTALLAAALGRTGAGRRLRAVAEDPEAAALRGINVTAFTAGSFAVAGALAGIAGVVLPAATGGAVVIALAPLYTIYGFVAMVVGGTGSLWGAVAGGWIVGIVEAAGAQVWHDGSLRPLFGLAVLLAVLLVRPQGLFAAPELRRA